LINALRELNLTSLNADTPTKIDKSSLTGYLDRFLTDHLTKYPEDTARMMTDQEVLRLRFFERNPDLVTPTNTNVFVNAISERDTTPTTPARTSSTQRVGPFTPRESVAEIGSANRARSVTKLGSDGTKPTPSRSRTTPSITHIDDEVIKVDTVKMSTAVLPNYGKKDADMIRGLQHLKDNRVSMDIDPRDFKMFTYWIREKEMRDHRGKKHIQSIILSVAPTVISVQKSNDNVRRQRI
jgi:hypothetical protein